MPALLRTNTAGRPALALVLVVAALVAACGSPTREPAGDPPARYRSAVYRDPAQWLCRPDHPDVCDGNLDATVIAPDGSTSIERWEPAADPRVDCFYVYPTVSRDPGANSDREPGLDEIETVRAQAARFGSTCRVFAPVYRQVTVAELARGIGQGGVDVGAIASVIGDEPAETAYADVRDAFLHYLDQDSGGRGFLLLGHSQGATALSRLLREEIAPRPERLARLVAAYTLGLPPGDRPDPAVTPPCTSANDLGCFVAYSSFAAASPPPVDTFFARAGEPGECTNPAAPGGGTAALHPYFPARPGPWLALARESVTTPYLSFAGRVSATCAHRDPFTWLEVTVAGDPEPVPAVLPPSWGLHHDDVQLALGDLIALAAEQAATYVAEGEARVP